MQKYISHHPLKLSKQVITFTVFLLFAMIVSFGTTSNRDILFGLLFIHVFFASGHLKFLKQHYIFLLLCLQYPLINILLLSLTNTGGAVKPHDAAGFEMWFTSILYIFIATLFYTSNRNSEIFVRYFIPTSVTVAFSVAAFQYFESSAGCRVALYNANVFAAPLFATGFAIIYLSYFYLNHKNLPKLAFVLIFMSLILSSVFAGARSIYLATTVVIFFLAFLMSARQKYADAGKLIAVFIVALVTSLLIENFTGCNFFSRIGNVLGFLKNSSSTVYLQGLENINDVPTGESSMTLRLEMWQRALSLLEGHYAFGLGAHYESQVSPGKHPHVHNMYLSWLIWGGIIGLISGFIFLIAAILSLKTVYLENLDRCVLLALPMIWIIAMLFDSFLFWKHHFYIFIMISTLCYALHSKHVTNR